MKFSKFIFGGLLGFGGIVLVMIGEATSNIVLVRMGVASTTIGIWILTWSK